MKNIIDKIKSADKREYKSIPFWSWNDKLDCDELRWQIRWMKNQGIGGYFMHARGGLTTEYLGKDWFDCVNACLDEGIKNGMDSWAYDENGWPSGFCGGKLLEEQENHDKYILAKTGAFDKNATVSYLIGESLVRCSDGDKNGEYLNLYEEISPSTADILNSEVVDKFISSTHEKYKRELGDDFKSLKGFFTDEPQYFRNHHPFTVKLIDYFKQNYNEDIYDNLGLMFVEADGFRQFRYKYWLAMQTLMLNAFSKKIYAWCDANNVMLTGHYVEEISLQHQMMCCAGVMPFYMFEHIPGIDNLCRTIKSSIVPKQVSSVAQQTGKKRVLTETFALAGWDVTPQELKRIAEWQYVNGVNLMCQHLLPYSEHGQRKRDYPAHFSWVNPWVRYNFKGFNDYFTDLGYLLGESCEIVNVALFCPVRSVYLYYKREVEDEKAKAIDKSYSDLADNLSAMNIPYHIIDETVIENIGSVDNGKFVVGDCKYDFIVFPKTINTGKTFNKLLTEFVNGGGKVLFADDKPSYIEGNEFDFNINSNTNFDEIINCQPYKIDNHNTQIQSTFRKFNGKYFIYAVNLSETKSYTVTYSGDFKSFELLNLESMQSQNISNTVTLKPFESKVLFLSDNTCDKDIKKEIIYLTKGYKVKNSTENYLTLDKVRFSTDGKTFSDKVAYMGVFNEMLNRRYNGDLFLRYDFNVNEIPFSIYFLSEDMNNVYCKVNGENCVFTDVSDFDKQIYKADIQKLVKVGNNVIDLKIHFFEGENVYYALFGENVTETLKNCLAYNTTIEACYLAGDFGVYSKSGFKKGTEKNVLISEDDFYISKAKKEITELVCDGYPFFAGSITLQKQMVIDNTDVILKLDGRYALAEVKVNGKKAQTGYFDREIDLSNLAIKGVNDFEITLISGNRNLMGPHHFKYGEEPFDVTPNTFELIGTWENAKSSAERGNYSFVRFGIFNE